jgi:hypothetical protein
MEFVTKSITPADAAEVVGLTPAQIGSWYDRYNLFPEKKAGKGIPVTYSFKDVMKLACMKALVDFGMKPASAAEALRRSNPLSIFHEGGFAGFDPGALPISQNGAGKYIVGCSNKTKASSTVWLWPIFEEVFPLHRDAILAQYDDGQQPEVMVAIDDYFQKIEALRKQQFGA